MKNFHISKITLYNLINKFSNDKFYFVGDEKIFILKFI